MSAVGAVTGNGIYSDLEYKGKTFQLAQWYLDALDAVATSAFRQAGTAAAALGGDVQAIARREAALSRMFALGHFSFDVLVRDGCLDDNPSLLALFLHKLMARVDATVTYEMALEIVKHDQNKVIKAIKNANPQAVPTNEAATAAPMQTAA